VPKAGVPKSYNDLLKPEWKGNIGMDSKAYEWFGTMLKAMGEEKGLAYMRELAKQAQLRAGRTLLAQLVAAGEFKGGLTAYSQTFVCASPSDGRANPIRSATPPMPVRFCRCHKALRFGALPTSEPSGMIDLSHINIESDSHETAADFRTARSATRSTARVAE
jgi:hypothetical protein